MSSSKHNTPRREFLRPDQVPRVHEGLRRPKHAFVSTATEEEMKEFCVDLQLAHFYIPLHSFYSFEDREVIKRAIRTFLTDEEVAESFVREIYPEDIEDEEKFSSIDKFLEGKSLGKLIEKIKAAKSAFEDKAKIDPPAADVAIP